MSQCPQQEPGSRERTHPTRERRGARFEDRTRVVSMKGGRSNHVSVSVPRCSVLSSSARVSASVVDWPAMQLFETRCQPHADMMHNNVQPHARHACPVSWKASLFDEVS